VTTRQLADRIGARARLAGAPLGSRELEQLAEYYQMLERWNRKFNLTSLSLLGAPDVTLDRLLMEPLVAARTVADEPLDWADFGTGGGSPALPLKILRPQARLTMVEARERKSAFLREVVVRLRIAGAVVVTARIEELPAIAGEQIFDMITVRGVRLDAPTLGVAASLLKARGQLLVFRSAGTPVLSNPRLKEIATRALEPSAGFLSTLQKAT